MKQWWLSGDPCALRMFTLEDSSAELVLNWTQLIFQALPPRARRMIAGASCGRAASDIHGIHDSSEASYLPVTSYDILWHWYGIVGRIRIIHQSGPPAAAAAAESTYSGSHHGPYEVLQRSTQCNCSQQMPRLWGSFGSCFSAMNPGFSNLIVSDRAQNQSSPGNAIATVSSNGYLH